MNVNIGTDAVGILRGWSVIGTSLLKWSSLASSQNRLALRPDSGSVAIVPQRKSAGTLAQAAHRFLRMKH